MQPKGAEIEAIGQWGLKLNFTVISGFYNLSWSTAYLWDNQLPSEILYMNFKRVIGEAPELPNLLTKYKLWQD